MKTLSFWSVGLGLLGLGLLGMGCSSVDASKLPNGGYRIQCEKGMSDCVARAETLCKGKGYTVLGGQNATHHVGGPSSSYQGVIFVGDLTVVCGAVTVEEPVCQAARESNPGEPGATAPPAVVPVAAASARACVPGASQACVGAAGCAGGQVCTSDGQGFGACDCGSSAPSTAPAPSVAAPVAPAPKISGAAPAAEPLTAPRR